MDYHHHTNSTYLYRQKSMHMDEMSVQSVLLNMELQQTRLRAEEDLKSRDDQIFHLKELLAAAIKDRDEARLNLKKAFSLHQSAPDSGISTIDYEYDPTRPGNGIDGFSSSDCDESIVSSPVAIKGPLPEKGKLLQAVMKAGPLLQTLLLAGPLPQWRHPPPPVDPSQIPPPPLPPHFLHQDDSINWPGRTGRKRGLPDDYDWSNESKHQRTAREALFS